MKYRVTICYDVEAGDQAEALLIASSNGGTIFLAAEVHALSQETHVSKQPE